MGFCSSICSGIGSAIAEVCRAIGGAIGSIASALSELGPIAEAVRGIIQAISSLLGISDKDEKAEELGYRASIVDKKIDDFDSVKEYKEYLAEIELTDEDIEKMNASKEVYATVGAAINVQGMSEVYGIDTLTLVGAIKVLNSDLGVDSAEDTKTILDKFAEKEIEPDLEGLKKGDIGVSEQIKIGDTLKEGISELKENKESVSDKLERLISGI